MLLFLGACGGDPILEAVVVDGAVEIRSDRAMRRVDVIDDHGLPVWSQTSPSGTRSVWAPAAPAGAETWTVRADFRGHAAALATVAAPAPAAAPDFDPAPGMVLPIAAAFPTDAFGRRDATLPTDRIVRPALAAWGIGWRPPPDQAPWSWQSLTLENEGAVPADVVVRASVVDATGAPVPGFRSRVRSQEGLHAVSVVVRVPPGESATAALPVYADLPTIEDGTYTRHIEVLPLGGEEPMHVVDRPLVVGSGGRLAPAAFVLALGVSAAGFTWGSLTIRDRRPSRRSSRISRVRGGSSYAAPLRRSTPR